MVALPTPALPEMVISIQRGCVILVGLVGRDVGVTAIGRRKSITGLGGRDRARPAARDGKRVAPRAVRGGRAAGIGDGCTCPSRPDAAADGVRDRRGGVVLIGLVGSEVL